MTLFRLDAYTSCAYRNWLDRQIIQEAAVPFSIIRLHDPPIQSSDRGTQSVLVELASHNGSRASLLFSVFDINRRGRVRIVKNELGGSATQQELRGWGSQWNEQGNWGVKPPKPQSIRTLRRGTPEFF